MITRAERYSLHYRITRIERTLGIVNKWTSMPEGADIYSEERQRFNDTRIEEQKRSGPNYVPPSGAGNSA